MTDRPNGRRDTSTDAQAIPQGRRSPAAAPDHHTYRPDPVGPGAMGADTGPTATQVIPTTGATSGMEWEPAQPISTRPARNRYQQPPDPPGPPGPPDRRALPPRPRPTRRRHTFRRVVVLLLVAVIAWVGAEVWAINSVWASVQRVDAEPASGHVAATKGHNILMVGSDSRTGLTKAQRKKLGTGFAEGARTDSIMVLHTGSGEPTLLSIPRDSYVDIPGHGKNKINAAFSIGGPPLLTATIEKATGLRIDGYLEIGFGGFASLVDSVGGVRMCLPKAIKDEKAHIDLPKGCQVLNGTNALGYVRARYFDPEGDLGRVKRQRQFLSALMDKIATPSTAFLPWKLHSVGTSAASAITIGKDDGKVETAKAFLGLRAVAGGKGHSVTVPISNPGVSTPVGSVVEWDATKAATLFKELAEDEPVTVTS